MGYKLLRIYKLELFKEHTLRLQCPGGVKDVEVLTQPCPPPSKSHQHRLRFLGGRLFLIKVVQGLASLPCLVLSILWCWG